MIFGDFSGFLRGSGFRVHVGCGLGGFFIQQKTIFRIFICDFPWFFDDFSGFQRGFGFCAHVGRGLGYFIFSPESDCS